MTNTPEKFPRAITDTSAVEVSVEDFNNWVQRIDLSKSIADIGTALVNAGMLSLLAFAAGHSISMTGIDKDGRLQELPRLEIEANIGQRPHIDYEMSPENQGSTRELDLDGLVVVSKIAKVLADKYDEGWGSFRFVVNGTTSAT